MIDYGRVRGTTEPPKTEITSRCVFLASNITVHTEIIDGEAQEVYEYDYIGYSKDEYLSQINAENVALKDELLDTQSALCDIYEALEGGLE